MSKWKSETISDVVLEINNDEFVLPVIQRRLVWTEDQIALLFDSAIKRNAFGGIMVLQERKNDKPLFESREFTSDGTPVKSTERSDHIERDRSFVIDGQQRLQAFFIGLKGTLEGKLLYIDLASDGLNADYDLRFTAQSAQLPKQSKDEDGLQRQKVWYSVPSLYERLRSANDADAVSREIIAHKNSEEKLNEQVETRIRKTISEFYQGIFIESAVGICKVDLLGEQAERNRRLRVVELFRRLNEGGTRLSAYDLIAARLKGFNYKMESFLDSQSKYSQIGLGQDELIRLLFILQDDSRREFSEVGEEDALFVIGNEERIVCVLKLVEQFLHATGLYEFFSGGRRSAIPLYFIAYHLYHQTADLTKLSEWFNRFDTKSNSTNTSGLYRWIHYSLLNGAFKSRGAGWIAYRTGVARILEAIQGTKGKPFPTDAIFKVYKEYPLTFFKDGGLDADDLDRLDQDFVLYLMYKKARQIRVNDVDHIHPRSRLMGKMETLGVQQHDIDTVRNYQLLDSATNRGEKQAKPFKQWLLSVEDPKLYVTRHLIPVEHEGLDLLDEKNFSFFLKERSGLILKSIQAEF
ncbi:DUF262 domain-containing protein [Nitrospira defluvii]|uniref:GmrSD restriction endonucleases N-terminal domain-containing protein n=1 Tax=Nitrospira defluvii TaxID=330214 RepID=A0ABN7LMH9_9BACT|nr:DUF262 domain-containing protein [Nitrospira defluvii]CAE6753236.1 conserved hypothetical protein [Nitrospira defluvii]